MGTHEVAGRLVRLQLTAEGIAHRSREHATLLLLQDRPLRADEIGALRKRINDLSLELDELAAAAGITD